MMMNIKKIAVLFIIVMFAGLVQGQTALELKVDSLFVIASSGELKFRDMVEPAQDSIASYGVGVVPRLVSKFTTKSARERLTIIQILKKIGSPAVPYLITSLNNPDGLVVQRVCWALGDIADTSAVEALIKVSDHSRWQVRDQALGALGDIKDIRATEIIMAGFTDSIGQVRKAACVASGKINITDAIPYLVHLLGDDFYGARMSAMESLKKMDTALVMKSIADSAYSSNRFVGSLGADILAQLTSDEATDLLKKLYESAPADLKIYFALAIIESDPDDRCGYHKTIMDSTTDRLELIKLQSALTAD